ncbi:class I SAM-dependent methyltransferase [Mycobacterium vicinigordonae]|uniref:Class I SAM-dependent methyltransferase n=1 Tax=Mycobacterium vicinigordonae TaxID=1719132 RepID=A0A7D6DVU3_9MYCO|nr:class I SAM-dependent methyltransferase [Mycobacterium vicinigordonae]
MGAGDGLLAYRLSAQIAEVTGVDSDPSVIERARSDWPGIAWIEGDVMTTPLPVDHYEVVAAVAMVHHLPDLHAALARLADLTATADLSASSAARAVRQSVIEMKRHSDEILVARGKKIAKLPRIGLTAVDQRRRQHAHWSTM